MAAATIKIDLKGEFLKHPTKRSQIVLGKAVKKAMVVSMALLERDIVRRTPVDTGTLRGSISSKIKGIGLDMVGKAFSPLVYAAPVELGISRRVMPNIAAIKRWVIHKRFQWGGMKPNQIAFLVARKIKERGTEGKFMFRDTFKADKKKVISIFRLYIRRAVKTL